MLSKFSRRSVSVSRTLSQPGVAIACASRSPSLRRSPALPSVCFCPACTKKTTISATARGFVSLSRTNHALPPQHLYEKLQENGLGFYAGVPDSLLKDFCAYVTDATPKQSHIIAANEGTAIATACGHHLATGQIPIVYLQNSGFGNIVNPLLSLVSPQVYKIPVLILIGWRGEPGVKDEPQHNVMGRLQEPLLESSELPYDVLPTEAGPALDACLATAVAKIKETNGPYALLVKKNSFEPYKLNSPPAESTAGPQQPATSSPTPAFNREGALKELLPYMRDYTVVSTTGVLSRELYELREAENEPLGSDFMCVGCMGHAGAIAHGIALGNPPKTKGVICLDGDGACLMHMGQLAINGQYRESTKLMHLLINNGLHESVGGQPTVGKAVDFTTIAKGCGYQYVRRVSDEKELGDAMLEMQASPHSSLFLEVMVKPGVKPNLGRPKSSPEQNKIAFVEKNFGFGAGASASESPDQSPKMAASVAA